MRNQSSGVSSDPNDPSLLVVVLTYCWFASKAYTTAPETGRESCVTVPEIVFPNAPLSIPQMTIDSGDTSNRVQLEKVDGGTNG